MAQQQYQSDLGALSRQWVERVKDIRQKARDENRRPDAGRAIESASLDGINIADILPDSDLFAAPVEQEYEEERLFVHSIDMDLFKPGRAPEPVTAPAAAAVKTPESAPAQTPAATAKAAPAVVPAAPPASSPALAPMEPLHRPVERRRSTWVQKIVAASLLVIAAVLIYAAIRLPSLRLHTAASVVPPMPLPVSDTAPADAADSGTGNNGPVSLNMAEEAYFSGQYLIAGEAYQKLIGRVSASFKDDVLIDFLRLRLALCQNGANRPDKAIEQLKKAGASYSPIVRMMAHYHHARIEMQQRHFLEAHMHACQALSLIETIDQVQPWQQELQRNCRFLIAASLSEKTLSLTDNDVHVSANMWPMLETADDPFAALPEEQLRKRLIVGAEKFHRAMLGPRFEANTSGKVREWSITCDGSSVDELLNRFASHAGYDVFWTDKANKAGIRQRPVQMHLAAVTDEQAISMIAGCAGLLAVIGRDSVVSLHYPQEAEYASEQVDLLGKRSISLWRQFSLAFHEDPYLANVHLAMGLLYAQQDLAAEAMAEYKIVANRFPHSPLAPDALYHAGMLKASLLDYHGAYQDLQCLVEQYPDSPMISPAYLSLADMMAKTGDEDGAATLYRKIYFLNASPESQMAASLAAGEIYYHKGDYLQAEKWLTQHIELQKDRIEKDYYHAYYVLGNTRLAMDKKDAACDALRVAVSGELTKQEYVAALTAFVEASIQASRFVEAFDILEETYLSQFSQDDSVKLIVLKSRLLRAMGLTEKAIVMLNDRIDYISDMGLKAQMGYELSCCYADQGQYDLAARKLAQNLELATGEMSNKSTLLLAEINLKQGRDQQALKLCQGLIAPDVDEAIRGQAMTLIAAIHQKQNNYDHAALILMGQTQ